MTKLRTFFDSIKHFKLTTPLAIIIGALILGLSHVSYGYVASNQGGKADSAMFAGKEIGDGDYIEGKEDGKIFLVEYSDPECPYCVSFHPTLKQLRSEYAEKIGFVYRHFPLTQIHANAFDESKAIACAGELQGSQGFYAYVDKLYGYKSDKKQTVLPANGREDIARDIGLDKAAFAQCMSKASIAEEINASINDGVQAGVQGTPTSFVIKKTRKGYEIVATIDGARPYDYVKAAIDQALDR